MPGFACHLFPIIRRWLVAVAVLLATAQAAVSAERIIVVFDASGSMWGQISGEAKIDIARSVLKRSVGEWRALNLDVGLMAYGHRRKGDCGDIEQLIPAGPVDPARFSALVDGISPKGKTPLSAAVRQAAKALRYTEEKATVILLSDGLETCNADPCALASELERDGVDFTAHVIGFDVRSVQDQSKLRCIADNTGGLFVPADNAAALSDAFKTVVEVEKKVATVTPLTLVAVNAATGAELSGPVNWQLDGGAEEIAATTPTGRWTIADIKDGTYTVRVSAGSFKDSGVYEVTSDRTRPVQVQVTAELPEADFKAGDTVPAGSPFTVEWTGPGADGDKIQLSRPGDVPGSGFVAEAGADGSPVTLSAPVEQGVYELRYYSAAFDKLLAQRKIVIGAPLPTAFLKALDEVPAGGNLAVQWEGPGHERDWIEIARPDQKVGKYVFYAYTKHGNPVQMRAPADVGTYEIRYINGTERKVMGRRPLTVVPADMELKAVDSIAAGAAFNIDWRGPGHNRDWIEISAAGSPAGKYVSYAYTRSGNPAQMRAPATPGAYEIRYINGSEKKIMASRALTVTEGGVTLKAVDEIGAGAAFNVDWQGPGGSRDWIEIAAAGSPAGKHVSYAYTRAGNPVQMRAPAAPGAYEVRYINGDEKKIMASRELTVTDAGVSLKAVERIAAGAGFNVNWNGPGDNRDWIEIAAVGSRAGKYVSYAYTRTGNPVQMRAPATPGAYEVRYINGSEKKIMATIALTVEDGGVTVKAVEEIAAGASFNVDWKGPGGKRDWVEIAAVGSRAGKYVSYAYTRSGNPVQMRAPAAPGAYEIRYINGDERKIMASRGLTVGAGGVTVKAVDQIVAGAALNVAWQGPGHNRDWIEISLAGSPPGKYVSYAYTRSGNPVQMRAPATPGAYEIRYVNGSERKVMGKRVLTVTAP